MYSDGSFAEGYAIGRDSGNNNGFGMDGGWAWWIIILLIFGWGGFGYGNGFGGNGGGSMMTGYDLGKLATTNDVAAGFANNAIVGNLNDLMLGQAGINQTLCQGFNGVNQTITTNGYETRSAIAGLGTQLANCCCELQKENLENRYINAQNTCNITTAIANSTRDIIDSQRNGTSQILGYLTQEKISALQAENSALLGQLSQANQTNNIIQALRPTPVPAYPVFAPTTSFAYPSGVTFGVNGNCNSNCGL